jgi:hypothetical protein
VNLAVHSQDTQIDCPQSTIVGCCATRSFGVGIAAKLQRIDAVSVAYLCFHSFNVVIEATLSLLKRFR